jgi:hypothetical protein
VSPIFVLNLSGKEFFGLYEHKSSSIASLQDSRISGFLSQPAFSSEEHDASNEDEKSD